MAIDASQRLDRFALIDVQILSRDVATSMRTRRGVPLPITLLSLLTACAEEVGSDGTVVDELPIGLTDTERQPQKGA